MWIGYIFSEVILGVHSTLGKCRPRGTRRMPAHVTESVAGTTTAYRDFLAFHDFRIVPAFLWREAPQRLDKVRQLKRVDCGHVPWLFDVAIDSFRRTKRFVNDAVGSKPAPVLRVWPVGGGFIIKFEQKNRSMPAEVVTIVILL